MIHGRYHVIAGVSVFVAFVAGGVGARAQWLDFSKKDEAPKMNLDAIEVSVAKSANVKTSQPQKPHRDPIHKAPDQGLAHDDKVKPDDKKKPDDQPKAKPDDDKTGPASTIPPDDNTAGPTSNIGKFDPTKHGNADADRGTEYEKGLVSDILGGFEFPQILNASGDPPVVCVQLSPDGHIVKTQFDQQSSDADWNHAAEIALKRFVDKENANPKPVPLDPEDQKWLTEWLCFRLTLDSKH